MPEDTTLYVVSDYDVNTGHINSVVKLDDGLNMYWKGFKE
jgi:hypothetical protein